MNDIIPICIFAKPPVAGKVKTRLLAELGAEAAAGLASAMLRDVWCAAACCTNGRPILAAAEPGGFPIDVSEENIWLQSEGDLGQRLECILRRALETAPAAIALGADSPLVAPAQIEESLAALETYDAAIGPCADGGFYLLALKRCPPGLFRDLPWSCAKTFEATKERLEQNRISVTAITPLFDVDTAEDLTLLGALLGESPELAPATRAWHQEYRLRCA